MLTRLHWCVARPLLLLLCLILLCPTALSAGQLSPYVVPDQLLKVPFGSRSHWAQPWRATEVVVPTFSFLNGIGINYQGQGNPDLEMRQLAEHGIRRVRIEIGWGNVNYADENRLNNAEKLRRIVEDCHLYGVRPLILLNANSGVPCPCVMFNRTVTVAAPAGSTSVTLNTVDGLQTGYSGLSNLTGYCAAEAIVTSISGNTVTLSKPLPKPIAAGASVPMATLKYRPFSDPESTDFSNTIAGWKRYVLTVGSFLQSCGYPATGVERSQHNGAGFDLEVWNELTFDSQYLSINNYYSPSLAKFNEGDIRKDIVAATCEARISKPDLFLGTEISDGFANTIPWPAGSTEPIGVDAISKHPYHGRSTFPDSSVKGTPLDANLAEDKSGWEPSYTSLFPEYFGSLIQTETVMRDLSPLTTNIYGTLHGVNSRRIGALPGAAPVTVWITEAGIGPDEDIPDIDVATARYVKAKIALRYYAFYLGEGAGMVTLYGDSSGDRDLGLVSDAFISYSRIPGAVYPQQDSSMLSPALAAIGNMSRCMSANVDAGLSDPGAAIRAIRVLSVSDDHNRTQFKGDGTSGHPSLFDRDVFGFFPTEVNSHCFAIPYYVMTRDVLHIYKKNLSGGHQFDMPSETFNVAIAGLKLRSVKLSSYDPIENKQYPVTNLTKKNDANVTLQVSATDYPRILIVKD